jgi:hypothetical protein
MTPTSRASTLSALVSILVAVTGCSDGDDPDAPTVGGEVAPELRDTEGEGMPDPDLVCGDETVASARSPSGTRVVFCVLAEGTEVVVEVGTMSQQAYLEREGAEAGAEAHLSNGCALRLFLQLTDDATPVPAALVDSCSEEIAPFAREVVTRPVFAARASEDAAVDAVAYSSYCESATAFRNERCYSCNGLPSHACVASCETWWHTSSDDTCGRFLGRWGNRADQTVTSCDGQTLFMGLRGDHFGWHVNFSVVVQPGYWAWGYMTWTSLFDSDFRFVTTSLWPGRHRLSKRFIDL